MSEKKQRAGLIVALVLIDALSITAALLLAFYLRLGSGLLPYTSPYSPTSYLGITWVAVPVWLVIFALHRLYRFDRLLGGADEYASIVSACTFGVIALVMLSYFQRGEDLSRGWLLLSWVMAILLVGGARFLARRVVFMLRRWGWFISRAVIVGANEQAKAIARQLHPPQSSGIAVVGFVDDFLPLGTQVLRDLCVLASPRSLPALVDEKQISEIIVVPQAMAWESFQEVVLANGKTHRAQVRISPGFYELLTTGVRVEHKSFVPLLTPERVRITGLDALLKSLFDLVFVLGGAILWLPTLGVLCVLKRIFTPGPLFRRQAVLGRLAKPFYAWGLAVGPDSADPDQATASFGRRLDRFIHRRGLYRLPQFVHVLRGQMSLVGPRPIAAGPGSVHHDWLPNLLTVKPGITGPWVLAGTAAEPVEEEKRLDLYYIRNWTIWFDFQILFRTLLIVLRGGAARA